MKKILLSALLAVLLCIPWTQAQQTTPYFEDFESMTASTTPTGWSITGSTTSTATGTPSYVWGVYEYQNNKTIRMYNYYVSSGVALINTPSIALPTSGTCQLVFKYSHNASCGDCYVKISTDGGTTFTDLDTLSTTGTGTKDDPGAMTEVTIDLASYLGDTAIIQFWSNANWGNGAIFVDDVEVGPAPTCFPVSDLVVSNITATSAIFSWTEYDYNDTQWQYLCIPSDSTPDWSTATIATTTSVTLSTLNPNTSYKFLVRTYCSATDQSKAVNTTFRTSCVAVTPESLGTISFEDSEGFVTGQGNMGNCWTVGNLQSTEGDYTPYIYANTTYSTYARTGNNCLRLKAYRYIASWDPSFSTYADSAYAVMPEFTYTGSIATYEAHFFMRKMSAVASYNDTLYVGIVSDPWDMSDLQIVGTCVNSTTTYTQHIVTFDSYTGGTTGYVVFLATLKDPNTNNGTTGFYIDDLQIIKGRATRTPVIDSVYNITTTTAQVAFSGSNATSYRLLAATQPVTDPSTYTNWAIDTTGITVSPATINVQPSTIYYLFIQGIGTDSSFISTSAVVFESGCDAISTFPWTEDFNAFTSGDFSKVCWVNEHVSGTGTKVAKISTATMGDNTTPMLSFSYQDEGTHTHVLTPEFNIPTANAYEFNLDVYRASRASYPDDAIRVIVDNGTGKDTTVIPYDKSTAGTVGAVTEDGWYTYTVSLPNAGLQKIEILDINYDGLATYMDNFRVRKTPTCVKVQDVTLRDNQPTQATIGWTMTTAAKYQVVLTTEKINPDTLATVPASAIAFNDSTASAVDSLIVTGLTSATKYYAYVRGLCTDEIGEWSIGISFRTACQVLTISKTNTYSEGFESLDDASQDVPCWDILTTSTGTYPQVAANTQYRQYAHTGNNCWSFGTYAGSNDTTYMVMPETTNPINTLRLKFWVYGMNSVASANDSILVGYMTDATDRSTFTRLYEYQAPNNDGYELIDVDFGEFPSATGRIAVVRVPVGSASWYATAYYGSMLDDFTIELAPTCKKVKDVTAHEITKESVTLAWTATTASQYNYIIADQSIDPENLDSAALTHIAVSGQTYTDSVFVNIGLAQATTYYAYVNGDCGAGDVSEWSDEFSFQTAMAMNYVDSFTVSMLGSTYKSNYGVDSLLAGSDNLIASTYSTWSINNYIGTDSASIKWNVYGVDNSAYFATPLVDLRNATDANVSFDVCRRAFNSADEATSVTSTDATVFHVMISTDGFQTIQNLLTFRNDSVEGDPVGDTSMYYGISTYYQNYSIDLSAYIGGNVQVLFGVSSHAYGHDYDLHLDNISIAGAYDTINVVANVNDTAMGYVTGAGKYLKGESVTLTAVANAGYRFVSWSNGSTSETIMFIATEDTTLTATFAAPVPYTVTVDIVGVGTVTGLGTYNEGDDVILTATPGDGYEFAGWSGDTTGIYIADLSDENIIFVITRDVHLTATFTEIKTSVNDVEASDYVAYTEGQRIVVAGVEGHTVSLFDATGRLVATRTNANETETFDAPIAGVYMIKVNGMNTTAIVVK